MIAEQKVKELEKSAVELAITVKQEALAESYAKILQKYTKSLQLPGFRKGKAPASILEQKFGPAMREESVYTIIDDAVQEALKNVEDKYRPLPYSTPNLVDEENISTDIDKNLEFAVTYDIMPLFELPDYTGLTVEVPKVEISDDTVNKEIEKLRDQNALVIEKDKAVESGDIVTIDYVEIDAEGNEVASTERKDFAFTVGSGTNFYKIDDDIVGMKKDEVKTIGKTFPEDFEYPEYAGKEISLKVELKQVKVRDIPVLDDEFAQDVSEDYKTVKDLVKATKEKLENSLESHLKETKLNALLDTILEKVTIAVPQSMIEMEVDSSWRRFVSQSGMSEDQILKFLEFQGQTKDDFTATWREPAEKSIRVQLVMEKIKEKENFTIDEKELESELETQLQGVTDENTKSYYKALIEDDMKIKKAGDFLLENNTLKDGKALSYDEFMADHQH
ncbi:trigger factor [Pleomorphochaeta sp. DL1XJH-081]|jgi:trigger factor|uniref:trigger factor n=1 Tax=Pleomorphochaeta sp. DL1XJH-081 TaxID=3409690 RepID=UPI003BB66A8D